MCLVVPPVSNVLLHNHWGSIELLLPQVLLLLSLITIITIESLAVHLLEFNPLSLDPHVLHVGTHSILMRTITLPIDRPNNNDDIIN